MDIKIRNIFTGKRVVAFMALIVLVGLAWSGMIEELRLIAG